jgi:hypothetical protein
LDILEGRGLVVIWVILVQPDLPELLEIPVQMDPQDLSDQQENSVQLDKLVSELLDQRVLEEILVPLDRLDQPARLDLPEIEETEDILDQMVIPDLLVLEKLDHKEILVF